jgi:polyhydroxybutyrate depolymerase
MLSASITRVLRWGAPWLLLGCASAQATSASGAAPVTANKPPLRLALCSERPRRLSGAPGAQQPRGCVATFTQQLTDAATRERLGDQLQRRYLVYAPVNLPATPVPVVFVFPGSTANAEAAAFYYTHTRFEELADRDGFIVVYGNGVAEAHSSDGQVPMPKGGFLPGCFVEHAGEGYDVQYVRQILSQLEAELPIDRSRIYATGLSQGGGLSFQLALEAPDLVAAIAPVAPVPIQPVGEWLQSCHPKPGHEDVAIAMLASTTDQYVAYTRGGSPRYPDVDYPGMEETRDAWLAALHLQGPPEVDVIPDHVSGDSYTPDTGLTSSRVERQRYPMGASGQELWFYKVVGMGHWWPNPVQMWGGLWPKLGKTNQDIDFADEAWTFFKRHQKRQPAPSVSQ